MVTNPVHSLFLERLDGLVQELVAFLVVYGGGERVLDPVREDVLSQVDHMIAFVGPVSLRKTTDLGRRRTYKRQ